MGAFVKRHLHIYARKIEQEWKIRRKRDQYALIQGVVRASFVEKVSLRIYRVLAEGEKESAFA